jgi:hypothetical protein
VEGNRGTALEFCIFGVVVVVVVGCCCTIPYQSSWKCFSSKEAMFGDQTDLLPLFFYLVWFATRHTRQKRSLKLKEQENKEPISIHVHARTQ